VGGWRPAPALLPRLPRQVERALPPPRTTIRLSRSRPALARSLGGCVLLLLLQPNMEAQAEAGDPSFRRRRRPQRRRPIDRRPRLSTVCLLAAAAAPAAAAAAAACPPACEPNRRSACSPQRAALKPAAPHRTHTCSARFSSAAAAALCARARGTAPRTPNAGTQTPRTRALRTRFAHFPDNLKTFKPFKFRMN